MHWEKSQTNPQLVRQTAGRYEVDLLTASILVRRGVAGGERLRFVLESDLRLLHNPFLFRHMERAVERIRRAAASAGPIMVFGDRDVDGITSTALLVRYLRELGAVVQWQLPRGEEDYGLSLAAVEAAFAGGVKLLITVDCGTSNLEEIGRARELGLEVIVVDHHNPPEELPPALAIINPKVEGETYPFRDLAGCGVVAKVIWALQMSATPLYGREDWLVHATPANQALQLDAVRLVNLVERERLRDLVPLEGGALAKSRIGTLVAGREVIVHDSGATERLLSRAGGVGELRSRDLQEPLSRHFPQLAGQSLLRILELSRLARYAPTEEVDMLVSLHTSLCLKEHHLTEELARHLDLAALGTVADLMPLADENRIIVRSGMETINRLQRAGLRELIIHQNLHDQRLGVKDLSWHITPVLNSAGRMGVPEKAAQILLSDDPQEVDRLIAEVLELNRTRKSVGDDVWEACLPRARESLERAAGKFVLVADRRIPRGLTGILAARLSGLFKVPALAVALSDRKAVGSLRSPYPLNGFLDRFADLLANYGGHDCAAGFHLDGERLSMFEERFYATAALHEPPLPEEPRMIIDAEVPPPYLNPDLVKVVETLEPYGEGWPPLVFLTRRVRIEDLSVMGRREAVHLRLLIGADRFRWPAVFWNAADRAGRDFGMSDTVDIVYRMGRNYFQNVETLRLTILDIHR